MNKQENEVEYIYERLINYFQDLKTIDICSIQNRIEYIKNEIEIRIESIKVDLENIQNEFYKQLDCLKTKLEGEYLNLMHYEATKYDKYVDDVCKLMKSFEDNRQLLEQNIQQAKKCTDEIKSSKSKLLNLSKKVEFKENNKYKLYSGLVGKIESEFLFVDKLKGTVATKNAINFELFQPTSICSYKDTELYITDAKLNSVIVINKHFEHIYSVSSIGKVEFKYPNGICTDDDDCIFICDGQLNKIIIANKNLNRVKYVFGKYGKRGGEFDNPKGICYKYGHLFVLDSNNCRIQKFNVDGSIVSIIDLCNSNVEKLNNPSKMEIMSNIIGVIDEFKYIYLYDFYGKLLQTFDLSNYGYLQSFCFFNDCLVVHSAHGYILVFEKDSNDNKFNQSIERNFYELKEFSEGMVGVNGKLVILLSYEKVFIVF